MLSFGTPCRVHFSGHTGFVYKSPNVWHFSIATWLRASLVSACSLGNRELGWKLAVRSWMLLSMAFLAAITSPCVPVCRLLSTTSKQPVSVAWSILMWSSWAERLCNFLWVVAASSSIRASFLALTVAISFSEKAVICVLNVA